MSVISNSSGVVTGVSSITNAGNYSRWPTQPASTTTSTTSGTGLTLNLATVPVNVRIAQEPP